MQAGLLRRLPVWRARIVLAAVLLVFSELIVWQTPLDFNAGQWAGWLLIYGALAAALADLLVRWRINEPLSLLLLAGVYGLLNATLISHISARDLPFSLIVRPLAAQPLACLGAVGAYAVLASGRATGPLAWLIALGAGLVWGVWVRWFPIVSDEVLPRASAAEALVLLGVAGAGLLGLAALLHRAPRIRRADWLLSRAEWTLIAGVLIAAMVVTADRKQVSEAGVTIVLLLAGFMLVVLYTTAVLRPDRALVDGWTPLHRPNPAAWLALLVPFLVAGAIGYALPGGAEGSTQSDALFGLLTAFGVAWPPGVSVLVGVRAVVQLTRQGM